MKFSTSTHLFKLVIRILSKINLKEIGNQLSDAISLETKNDKIILRVVTFDLSVEYVVPIQNESKKDETLLLPLQTLDAVVDTVVDSMITVEKKENQVEIKTNSSVSNILLPHTSGSTPEMPKKGSKISSINLPREIMIEGLKGVSHACAVSVVKPEIASVYMYSKENTLYFVATDTFQLSEMRFNLETPQKTDFEVLIPNKNIPTIVKILEGSINSGVLIERMEDGLFITSDDFTLYSRITQGNFFNYKDSLPKEFEIEFTMLKSDVVNFFKKARHFSNELHRVHIDTQKNNMTLSFENEKSGSTRDIIQLEDKKGDGKIATYNYKYILNALQIIRDDRIQLRFSKNGLGPVVIKGVTDNSFFSIVAPLISA